MKKYLLCIDNGGTYIKASLLDYQGKQHYQTKRKNGVLNLGNGQVEFDLEKLWATNCECIRAVISDNNVDPQEIACVAFAGQGKGLYMVDREGKCFRNAITSSDARAESYCKQWKDDGTAEQQYSCTYQYPMAAQTVPMLRWLKQNEPENYARIGWIFSMKDYLVYRMTGNAVAGLGSQSGTCLVNLNTGEYDLSLLELFGIPEVADKLPTLKGDTELCGAVSAQAEQECGCAAGTPVAAGMFDVDAAALAMGTLAPEDMFIILGTCGINGYIADAPVTNRTITYNSLYPIPGKYLIQEGGNASSGVLEWVVKVLFENNRDNIYDEINAIVESVPADASVPVFIPSLSGFTHGCTQGSAESRGAWIGLCPEHSRAEMLRAVYEGVVFTHMIEIDDLLKNRSKPEKVRIAGGATASKVWMQMFADALQIPVEIITEGETGAKGVAITASVAANIYSDLNAAVKAMVVPGTVIMPDKDKADVYREKFLRFRRIMELAETIWPEFKTNSES